MEKQMRVFQELLQLRLTFMHLPQPIPLELIPSTRACPAGSIALCERNAPQCTDSTMNILPLLIRR